MLSMFSYISDEINISTDQILRLKALFKSKCCLASQSVNDLTKSVGLIWISVGVGVRVIKLNSSDIEFKCLNSFCLLISRNLALVHLSSLTSVNHYIINMMVMVILL